MGELSQALRSIEQRHQEHHWHAWHSDTGQLWATSPHCLDPNGSGTTVDGRSTEVLEREIAKVEREFDRYTGWAAA